MSNIAHGNAYDKGPGLRGWFVGRFMPSDDPRYAEDVELKWSTHEPGEQRRPAAARDDCTTVSILIEGDFTITIEGEVFNLSKQGDYVLWHPGSHHTWTANKRSVMLTVRWPSFDEATTP